jgi:hypothetical protein
MSDHTAIQFRNQGYREGPGFTQRLDNERLRLIADRQGFECGDGQFGDRVYVPVGFASNDNFRFQWFGSM